MGRAGSVSSTRPATAEMPPKAVRASSGTLKVIVSMPDFITAVPSIMCRTFFAVSGEGAGDWGAGERAAGERKGESKCAGAARTEESGRGARASPDKREKLSASKSR